MSRWGVVIADFNGQGDDQVSAKAGDRIQIVEGLFFLLSSFSKLTLHKDYQDGWCEVVKDKDTQGIFPSAYFQYDEEIAALEETAAPASSSPLPSATTPSPPPAAVQQPVFVPKPDPAAAAAAVAAAELAFKTQQEQQELEHRRILREKELEVEDRFAHLMTDRETQVANKHRAEMADMRRAFQLDRDQLVARAQQLEQNVNELRSHIDRESQGKLQIQQTLDAMRASNAELVQQMNDLKRNASQHVRQKELELQERLQLVMAEKQSLEAEFAKQQQRMQQAKHEETLMREQQAKQRAEMFLSEKEKGNQLVHQLQSMQAQHEQEVRRLRQEIDTEKQFALQNTQQQIAAIKDRASALIAEERKSFSLQLEQEKQALRSKTQEMERNMQAQLHTVNARLQEVEQSLTTESQMRSLLQHEKQEWIGDANRKQEQLVNLQTQLQEERVRNAQLGNQLGDATNRLQRGSAAYQELKQTHEQLVKVNAELNEKHTALQRDYALAVPDLKTKLEVANRALQDTQKRLQQVERENEERIRSFAQQQEQLVRAKAIAESEKQRVEQEAQRKQEENDRIAQSIRSSSRPMAPPQPYYAPPAVYNTRPPPPTYNAPPPPPPGVMVPQQQQQRPPAPMMGYPQQQQYGAYPQPYPNQPQYPQQYRSAPGDPFSSLNPVAPKKW